MNKEFEICEHGEIYCKCPLCSLTKIKDNKIEKIPKKKPKTRPRKLL